MLFENQEFLFWLSAFIRVYPRLKNLSETKDVARLQCRLRRFRKREDSLDFEVSAKSTQKIPQDPLSFNPLLLGERGG